MGIVRSVMLFQLKIIIRKLKLLANYVLPIMYSDVIKIKFVLNLSTKSGASTHTDFSNKLDFSIKQESSRKQHRSSKQNSSHDQGISNSYKIDVDPDLLSDKLREFLEKSDRSESDNIMIKMIIDEVLTVKATTERQYNSICKKNMIEIKIY